MGKVAANILIVVVALALGFYQLYLKPFLFAAGVVPNRKIHPLGNNDCKGIPDLQACEKIILHQPSGLLYLACSSLSSRQHWVPSLNQFNASGASTADYIATYNPSNGQINRFSYPDFNDGRGLSLHGMDVVTSDSSPSEIYIYVVNHRIPLGDVSAEKVGADSVVEIFKAGVGDYTLRHVKTVQDPTIISPNDVLGSTDGKSFYVTNDNGARVGVMKYLTLFGHKSSSVVYCHVDDGCKFAITKTHASNGIAGAPNGTIYVGNSILGGVSVLERQADNSLVITDSIRTDFPLDNLHVDEDGQLWAASLPKILITKAHIADPLHKSAPSSAHKISINTGVNAFFGEKYKIEKVFEDDGKLASGITSVVYDRRRKLLFLSGIASHKLVVCNT